LLDLYPQENWQPWKFASGSLPTHWWSDFQHQHEYFQWLGTRLNFTSMDDWYKLTKKDLLNNYGTPK